MKFVIAAELDAAIWSCVTAQDARCAVAFLGKGAGSLFVPGVRARIVCNLLAGGTNPHEVKRLCNAGHKVRQHDTLHAKVYLGGRNVVITSANLSANGLGLEAKEQAHWIEAGIVTDEIGEATDWFERLWSDPATRIITPEDLKNAICNWQARRFVKPTLRSFAEFDPTATDFPLLYSWYDGDVTLNKKSVKAQLGITGDDAYTIIANSLEVDDEGDVQFMSAGRWVLWWRETKRELPHRTAGLEWGKIGKRVSQALRNDNGLWKDCILIDPEARPIPFDLDQAFSRSFRSTLSKPKFKLLRTWEDRKPYFSPRMGMMQEFWAELKGRYTREEP